MASVPAYIDAAGALALVELALPSTDRRRVVFAAASAGDRLLFVTQATADIDAVGWNYSPATTTQATAWPRVDALGAAVDPDTDDPVVAGGVALVTGCPSVVYLACSLQAAHRAGLAAGVGAGANVEAAAQRGVVSHSAKGRSETIDGAVARRAFSRLCVEAQRLLTKYQRRSSPIV